ncbi:MAG: class I SAM-dependent methyltransferase [Acidobacteriota bacterium]
MVLAFRRALGRVLYRLRPGIPNFKSYLPFVAGKAGLEIGGPSAIFRSGKALPLYSQIASLDNCDFSSSTVWADHDKQFQFSPEKAPGKSFFCEGSELTPIPDHSYDFLLSSHNLEHFANPLKALQEWKRVLRPGGALILVLPYYKRTFDHRRSPTPVSDMWSDFERNIGEDDLSHLPEILAKHDHSRDRAAGSVADFERRSRENFNNRCLHHHVFDENNSRELLTSAGFNVHAVDLSCTIDICLLATVADAK